MKQLAILAVAMLFCIPLAAQKYPERRIVRAGNKQYERENYVESEISYRRALEKAPATYEAAGNLAKSLYKQKRYDEAAQLLSQLAPNAQNRDQAAATHYDNGNALFQQRKLEEALEAYKQSLRINPNDMEAKFNLAYTQKLIDENKKDQDKDNKDNKDNKDQQDQQNQQNQQPKPGEEKPEPAQASEGKISKEEADRMLEAVQMSEDKAREKMEEKKGKPVPRGGKNW